MAIDVSALVTPFEGESPVGPNLEYDNEFVELERLIQGKPEAQYGETVIEAVEPDWKLVKEKSLSLLLNTKDLRLSVYLSQALAYTNQWFGLEQGLQLVAEFLTKYWTELHPKLDPEDNHDPTIRVNIVSSLNDLNFIRKLRNLPLVSSDQHGTFSLRQVEIGTGAASAGSEEEAVDKRAIEHAFDDMETIALQRLTNCLANAIQHIEIIKTVFIEQAGYLSSVNLLSLTDVFTKAHGFVSEKLALRVEVNNVDANAPQMSASGNANQISGRADVVRLLDKICDYYQVNEPSSPVPLLLQRAKRLATMNFLEILQDVAPQSHSETEVLFRTNQQS